MIAFTASLPTFGWPSAISPASWPAVHLLMICSEPWASLYPSGSRYHLHHSPSIGSVLRQLLHDRAAGTVAVIDLRLSHLSHLDASLAPRRVSGTSTRLSHLDALHATSRVAERVTTRRNTSNSHSLSMCASLILSPRSSTSSSSMPPADRKWICLGMSTPLSYAGRQHEGRLRLQVQAEANAQCYGYDNTIEVTTRTHTHTYTCTFCQQRRETIECSRT